MHNLLKDDARLRHLGSLALAGELSESELNELARLSLAKKAHREARVARIAELRAVLTAEGINPTDLYSTHEMTQALKTAGVSTGPGDGGPIRTRPAAPTRSEKATNGRPDYSRRKSGLVLVEALTLGGRGSPCRYCQGESLAKPYVAKAFKALDDGQLETNLARHYTEAGRAYFATADGQAELARLLRFIQTRKVNPRR